MISGAALAGVLARMGQWRKPDDRVDWWKAAGECMSVPSITFIVAGGVEYFAPDLGLPIVAAIASFVGIIGTAGIESIGMPYIKKRLGL